ATVGTFYFQEKSNSRSFSNTREFSARQFNSEAFQGTRAASGISSQQPIGNSQLSYSTRPARVRDAHDADKAATSRAFAENRPFLGQGKSQKALNRKNAPLTIEQVRELLNKNKYRTEPVHYSLMNHATGRSLRLSKASVGAE